MIIEEQVILSKVGEIREPSKGYIQEIVVVPIEKLKVIAVQRKPSRFMIQRLVESMRKIGFTTPVIAIKGKGDDYIIIDGQHRLLAAGELGIKELPCIVVPEKYAHDLMELNIEKQMSIREKAYVTLNVYRMYIEESPSMNEDAPVIMDSIEASYYITLGMAYEANPRFFGSAYESILRKVDKFLNISLTEAAKERQRMAKIVLNSDEAARKAVDKVGELGIIHPFLYKEIISFCSPIGKRRKIEETFDSVFEKLIENLKELAERPERIRSYKFSEETQ